MTRGEIEHKIERIYSDLVATGSVDYYGLLGGNAGVLLFYSYLYIIKEDDSIITNIRYEVEKSFALYGMSQPEHSFGYGLSGLGWVLLELVDIGILDASTSIIDFNKVDNTILDSLKEDKSFKNYDFFSGLIGKGIYLLKRKYNPNTKDGLAKIAHILKDISFENENGIFWLDSSNKNIINYNNVNLGLAHGVPSIINFLLMVYKQGIERDLIYEMLNKSIKWLLKTATEVNDTYSFPYFFNTSLRYDNTGYMYGRLAWCYGDLGIAYTLIFAGNILNDKNYFQIGLNIANKMAERTNQGDCMINDACICHGTTGVAAIFSKIYKITSLDLFKQASDFWYKQTLNITNHTNGIGGYKYWTKTTENDTGQYTNISGFLEGASGVGISLITYAYPEHSLFFDWGKLMLLD